MKYFYIQTFGCQMNVYDSMRIESALLQNDFYKTEDIKIADLIILNTCSVREKASNKVFSALGRIRKIKKKNALFGIIGCVAKEEGEHAFLRIPELNFVLGPQSYHKLIDIINNKETKILNINLSGLEKFDEMPRLINSSNIAYIPIQEGCNHVCSYCIVPYTRGREISRSFDDVIKDVKDISNQGAIEICFLGQNVNGYKYGKYRLSDLIKETAKIESIKRIRFTSSYPTEMTDDLINLFKTESKLLPFLNMPIQSGSQKVLKDMNRHYSLEEYLDIINKLKQVNKNVQISSDFIVGFPGETDDDFNDTLEIIKKVRFINSFSFKYSKRPHTPAIIFKNQIDEKVKKERLYKLEILLNKIQQEFNHSCIGKTFECIYEGIDKTKENFILRTPFMQPCIVKKTNINTEKLIKVKVIKSTKSALYGDILDN